MYSYKSVLVMIPYLNGAILAASSQPAPTPTVRACARESLLSSKTLRFHDSFVLFTLIVQVTDSHGTLTEKIKINKKHFLRIVTKGR